MSTVIKMRAARVSEFDSSGQDLREVQLIATDRDNAALEPGMVLGANFSATLFAPGGAEIEHDGLYTVTIAPAAPV